ncbi:ATP-binding cassette domain-containing protein [Flagellimonas flava]|uniref:ATP-binding cassette domain-containing protein n=1 Tax=Flagellimonas flava TaxID=570519 RepID=UPI003D649DCE
MVLEIDNVELNFGQKKILSGIYLNAQSGSITSILGRNGAGKTSLFNILFGCLKPKYKSIRIDGTPISKHLFQSNEIAYLPQHQLLPSKLSVRKAFDLFKVDWDLFIEEFDSFRLYENNKISEISSGERRVLETYLILYLDKKIILLDEPFSYIAPLYVDKFKQIILDKKKERITLITDHFYRDILQISDKTYLLKNGCSKLIKDSKELIDNGYILSNSQQK